jgi:hypothetical protein
MNYESEDTSTEVSFIIKQASSSKTKWCLIHLQYNIILLIKVNLMFDPDTTLTISWISVHVLPLQKIKYYNKLT